MLGFGFLGIILIWSIYNSCVPIFLREYQLPLWLVGLVMTFDNIAGGLMDLLGHRILFLFSACSMLVAMLACVPVGAKLTVPPDLRREPCWELSLGSFAGSR